MRQVFLDEQTARVDHETEPDLLHRENDPMWRPGSRIEVGFDILGRVGGGWKSSPIPRTPSMER